MTRFKSIFAAVVVAAIVGIVPANAAVNVMFVGSGSSAMFQQFSLAAFNGLCTTNDTGCQHFSVNGKNGANNYAQVFDQRSGSIPVQGGNLWVVWGTNGANTDVWAYLTLDSILGNRCFFATPRCILQIDSGVTTTTPPAAQTNLISAALYDGGNPPDAALLPLAVYTALNGKTVTAGLTDIRPEDALFAEKRIVSVLNSTTYAGLGYGTGPTTLIGTAILGAAAYSGGSALPVSFNITGKDPFTALNVPPSATISVGAAPIVFIVNRTAGGAIAAADPQNLNRFSAQLLFGGRDCETSIFGITNGAVSGPVHVVKREPLSGTMETTENTVFRTKSQPNSTQEALWNPATDNGIVKPCQNGGGDRGHAIGTGNAVKGVRLTADSIGYTFFSYGNVSSIAGNANYGYLTLDGVDPINAAYTNGNLPTCAGPCALAPNTSFPNIRNGSYSAWSKYRVVTDKTGANFTNASALVAEAQKTVNAKIPDFVPNTPQADGDLGLLVFRSHYGSGAKNGINVLPETGQDMGGCIYHIADEVALGGVNQLINCQQ